MAQTILIQTSLNVLHFPDLYVNLFGLEFPVVYDTCGDDGGVVPVAAAAVVLPRVVTLPRLARDASYRTKHSTSFRLVRLWFPQSCAFFPLAGMAKCTLRAEEYNNMQDVQMMCCFHVCCFGQ